MMEQEIKDILEKPFAEADIKKDYNKKDYVKPHLIIRRLNKAYGQDGWQFELLERIVEHDTIIQFGRLGTKNDAGEMIWKENCGARRCSYIKGKDGRPSDTRLDVGNDYKSAASNCLKRCAMMHGIALDLYGDPEQSEQSGADSPQKPQDAPNKPSAKSEQGKDAGNTQSGKKEPPSELAKAIQAAKDREREVMIASGLTQKALRALLIGEGKEITRTLDGMALYVGLLNDESNWKDKDADKATSPENLEEDARAKDE